ncbi:MAG: HD domain-containing protein [Cyclobacteriaceae bacterium]|nr:HD domain-containing protein [Cyclobacteriaceae bacterium]
MQNKVNEIVTEIFDLYEKFGHEDYIGEPVSQLEHMSQSAQLALAEGYDDEVVLAAFFHDIGHICVNTNDTNTMGGYGVKRHEQIGADFLRQKGFPERMARLVENHVQAKRYLTFKNPTYYQNLSEASKRTLEYQGGVMKPQEAELFENDSLFEVSIKMRYWDEQAKEMHVPVPDLTQLKYSAIKILNGQPR